MPGLVPVIQAVERMRRDGGLIDHPRLFDVGGRDKRGHDDWWSKGMGENGLTGGCQCGAVRYRLETAPTHTNICHCRMCQKALAVPFGAFASVPSDKLTFTRGAPKFYQSSAIAKRGFCADCGTPLTYGGLNSPRVSVTTCSLDNPNAAAPTEQLDAEFAVAWVKDCLTLPNTPIAAWLKSKHITDIDSRQHPDHD